MADAWETLISNSTLTPAPGIDAWIHLNNQGGGGTTRYPAYVSGVDYAAYSAVLSGMVSYESRSAATLSLIDLVSASPEPPAPLSSVLVLGIVLPGTISSAVAIGENGVAGISNIQASP